MTEDERIERVATLWDRALPHLEDALAHASGTHRIEDVFRALSAGELTLWMGERCAGVSEILVFPRRRVLNLFLVGGDLHEMRKLQPGIEAYARAQACAAMMFHGRMTAAAKTASGWARAWPDYDPKWICLTKEL